MIAPFMGKIPLVAIENESDPTVSKATERTELPISVVVVSYNSRKLLRSCLASIEAEQPAQVIVVDNASSDGSGEMVAQDLPWVKLIQSKRNNGYGGAANLAIASCSSKYVLLLNCDTLLQPGSLKALRIYLDQHPRVAIAGPSLVNPDGTRQTSCFPFPTPQQILLRETSLYKIWPDGLSSNSLRIAKAVPWVLGAALAIRRQAFESVGGFDRTFFMYYEEVDICYRLNKSGWQTHFMPASIVTHVGGGSTKQQRTAMAIQLYKSLCHFYQQHYSRMQRFQLKVVLTYLMLRNIIKEIFRVAGRSFRRQADSQSNDLLAWRSVLSNVWSKNGWL